MNVATTTVGTPTRDEHKAVVQAVVQDLLIEEAPDQLADLPVVFDTVYSLTERRLDRAGRTDPAEGLPFKAPFVAGTALGSAVWVAASLARARRLHADAAETEALIQRLGEHAGSESSVRETEERLDGVYASLADLTQRLDAREQEHAAGRSEGPLPDDPPTPPDPTRQAAELTLLVGRRGPEGRSFLLGYRLLGRDAAGRPIHLRCVTSLLHRDPGPYVAELLTDGTARPSAEWIEQVGSLLGRQLLPGKLAAQLWVHAGGGSTLQVISEEPGIPWEILRLSASGVGAGGNGPFLADAFALCEWPTDGRQVTGLSARRIAVIAPADHTLRNVEEEVAFLLGLAGESREVVRLDASTDVLLQTFSGGDFDVLHFTGHGMARGDNPDRWALLLENGEPFAPAALPAASASAPGPSLVVLNACLTAREGRALTGIGSLAQGFLQAGAGAVIGTRWAVSDGAARDFAQRFYGLFLTGTPIAETVRRSRGPRESDPDGGSTRLAYTVLGHPLARCSA